MRQPLVKTLIVLVTLVVLVGSLGLALAGCGSEERVSPGAPSRQTSTESGPAPWPTEGSSPVRLSGDGRYFGYIRASSANPPTISFDVAQFFYGRSVQEAAEKDGVVKLGEPVSNDHYERNPERRAESLKLAASAKVTAAWPASFLMRFVTRKQYDDCEPEYRRYGACTQVPLSLPVFFKAVSELDRLYGIPAWVKIRDAVVVRIDEQYFP